MQGTLMLAVIAQTDALELTADQIVNLSYLATIGIIVMWMVFWIIVLLQRKESVSDIVIKPAFFRTVAVVGVVATTAVLALAGRLESNLSGAILSGTVGFVLGHLSNREPNS